MYAGGGEPSGARGKPLFYEDMKEKSRTFLLERLKLTFLDSSAFP